MNKNSKKITMFLALFTMLMISGVGNSSAAVADGDYVEASVSTVTDGSYPIARSLYFYTDGTPTGIVADFINWILGPEGQAIAADEGYVPLTPVAYIHNGNSETTLIIDGSTTVSPIVEASESIYEGNNTGVDVQVSGTGSGTGIAQLIAGNCDIAMASRAMKDSEKADLPNWNEIVVANDGIAIVVHPDNPIEKITMAELKAIYTGEEITPANNSITNWGHLGGGDNPISVVNRETTSGTYGFFHENVCDEEDFRTDEYIQEKNSNGAAATEVANNPNAIAYVGLGYIDGLKVVGIADSTETPNVMDIEEDSGIPGFLGFQIFIVLGIGSALLIYKKKTQ